MTTDNKTLAVDVLEVMLELDDELQLIVGREGEGCYWSVDGVDLLQRCAAARAAVAELIEAGERLQQHPDDLEIQADFCRALARVKGESA